MEGRVAIITGSSSGIGRATCACLLEAGWSAVGVDRALVANDLAGRMEHVPGNVADPRVSRAAVERALDRFGRVDALVNAAGVIAFDHTSADEAIERWRDVIDTNLTGTYLMCARALPHLCDVGGAIVNVASVAALQGNAYMAAYCASKAGVVALTKALAMEHIHDDVRINAVAPGGVDTPMLASLRMPRDVRPDLVGRYSPIRPLLEAADVAAVIVFLCSPLARGIHGAVVAVDGGMSAG